MLREFMGLPAHALIVHAAVVFVPLAVVSAIVYAVLPASRRYLWWVVLGLGVVAPLTAWAARLSGNEYKAYWVAHGASGEYLAHVDTHRTRCTATRPHCSPPDSAWSCWSWSSSCCRGRPSWAVRRSRSPPNPVLASRRPWWWSR